MKAGRIVGSLEAVQRRGHVYCGVDGRRCLVGGVVVVVVVVVAIDGRCGAGRVWLEVVFVDRRLLGRIDAEIFGQRRSNPEEGRHDWWGQSCCLDSTLESVETKSLQLLRTQRYCR